MGITKTDGFSLETIDLAEMLKAVGHPARLSILQYLSTMPGCICNDIVDELPLAQPTISRHLSELKKVGLIKGSIEGKNICYCIDEKQWQKLENILNEISKNLSCKDNYC